MSGKIEARKSREQSGGSSKGTFLRCLRIKLLQKGRDNAGKDVDSMWKEMTTHIQKMVIEVFGVNRGNKCEAKNTWWWNDDVQKTISEKKECYKRLHHIMSDENIQKYKKSQKKCKESCERNI
jgi:hypothetical protein